MKAFARLETEIDKQHYCFTPVGSSDFKNCLRLKEGDFVCIESWTERNVGFHRKYFSLLNKAISLFPDDPQYIPFCNLDTLRHYLMKCGGFFDEYITPDGEVIQKVKSISFKKMEQIEFEKVYNTTLDMILKYLLPHIQQAEFEKHLLNYC